MVSKTIDLGSKVDIRIVSQLGRPMQEDEEEKVYKSQVYDILENDEIEMLMPMEGGKLMLLSLGLRYEFLFYTHGGLYKAVGHVKERYKTDNLYIVRVELHTPLSKFQRRQFFRLKCIIDMTYCMITKEHSEMPDTDELIKLLRDEGVYEEQKKARIVDISGGGVRFVSEEENPSDGYVLMVIKLHNGKQKKQYHIAGRVIKCVPAEQSGAREMKFESRVEFILKDSKMQEEIVQYIFAEERKARKIDKG